MGAKRKGKIVKINFLSVCNHISAPIGQIWFIFGTNDEYHGFLISYKFRQNWPINTWVIIAPLWKRGGYRGFGLSVILSVCSSVCLFVSFDRHNLLFPLIIFRTLIEFIQILYVHWYWHDLAWGLLHIICTRVMALHLRHNFVYAQYLENYLTYFHQILYMHWYWQDVAWDFYTSFFGNCYQSYGPLFMPKFVSPQCLENHLVEFHQILYVHSSWQNLAWVVTRHFSHICTRVMFPDLRRNFISAQYLLWCELLFFRTEEKRCQGCWQRRWASCIQKKEKRLVKMFNRF